MHPNVSYFLVLIPFRFLLYFQRSTQNEPEHNSATSEAHTPISGTFSLPSTLWTTPWIEPPTSDEINVENIESLRDTIFDKAQHSDQYDNPPMFELTGSSTSHLAQNLIGAIKNALQDNNFENVLSPSRDFAM